MLYLTSDYNLKNFKETMLTGHMYVIRDLDTGHRDDWCRGDFV